MQRAFTMALIGSAWLFTPARADDAIADNSRAKFLAPFFDTQTFGVIRIDLARLDAPAIFRTLTSLQELRPSEMADTQDASGRLIADLKKAGASELYVLLDLADLPGNHPPIVVPLAKEADEAALTRLLSVEIDRQVPADWFRGNTCIELHGALISAGAAVRERLMHLKAIPNPHLEKACAAAGDAPVQLLLLPTTDMLRVADETTAALSSTQSPTTTSMFRRGFQWSTLVVSREADIRLIIQSQDSSAAVQLHDLLATGLRAMTADPSIRRLYATWDQVRTKITPQVSGDRLHLEIDKNQLKTVFGPALARARSGFNWSVASLKFRKIGLAMHNYHDSKGYFPPAAISDSHGNRLLSWRVAILPYLDQRKLYDEFHLNEAWDSEHNKMLISRIPDAYCSRPSLARQGKTSYLGVAGKSAMFPPDLKRVTIRDVTDGTANTVWVVDVDEGRAVPWTKPEDFDYDPKNPRAGLADFANGFPTLFVDSSAQVLPSNIDAKTLSALFTRNGGEVIPPTVP